MRDKDAMAAIYLDTPGCGIVSPEATNEGVRFYQSLESNSSQNAIHWRDVTAAQIRKNIASFLDSPEENVALIPNFSFGINGVVQSLKGTEKILLYKKDYPSLTNPFTVNNFNITWFSSADNFTISPDTIEQELKHQKIDLLAISHVQWLSGALIDLKAIIQICHKYNIKVIVDTTQSLGSMPISVKDLEPDVLIASNYKWMNAGFGTGIIYLSDAFLKAFPPVLGGVNSYEIIAGKSHRKPSARDFEPGHINMAGFSVLNAAILDKNKRGLSQIEKHNHQLMEQFVSRCPDLPATLIGTPTMKNRNSIAVLEDKNGLGGWLQKNNFTVTLRNQTIRLGFHYYNTTKEVEQLISCIKNLPL